MRVLIASATGVAAGVWLLIGALFPARRPLGLALTRLQQPLQPARSRTSGRGAGLVAVVERAITRTARLRPALEITGRTPQRFATQLTVATLTGAMAGPLVGIAVSGVTATRWWSFPAILAPTGAALGAAVTVAVLRADARRARRDLRHALGSWLDVVVLLIASGIGPESAMTDAARAGSGPAFAQLHRIVAEASFGASLWDAFDRGGERLGVVELRELAAVAQLAGQSGASIRESLMTKARSLRGHLLAEQEAAAAARARMMFGPIVVIAFAFLTYLVYPLLTNLRLPS